MRVWFLLSPLIKLLNHNDLFSCLAALQHDGDLGDMSTFQYRSEMTNCDSLFLACRLKRTILDHVHSLEAKNVLTFGHLDAGGDDGLVRSQQDRSRQPPGCCRMTCIVYISPFLNWA